MNAPKCSDPRRSSPEVKGTKKYPDNIYTSIVARKFLSKYTTKYLCFYSIAENEVNGKCEPESNDLKKAADMGDGGGNTDDGRHGRADMDDVMRTLQYTNTSKRVAKIMGESKQDC